MTKRDELIALGGVGAKVRELEWVEMPDRDPESASWIAETDLGRSYRVFAAWWGAQNKYGYVFDGFYHTENEAKAAAQADYEQRILSALEVPAAGDGEPVANKRPVAFRVRKYQGSDQFDVFADEADALTRADARGIDYEGLYLVADRYTAPPAGAGMREALENGPHYLGAIRQRLERLYEEHPNDPRLREQLSDEVDWVNALYEALTAPGATTKSDGGVEGHAEYRQGLPVSVGDKKASNAVDVASETDDAATGHPRAAGVEPGPSEPKNYFFETEEEAAEAADNGRNTGGKSYYRPSDPSSTRSEVTVSVSKDTLLSLISALDRATGDTDPAIDPDATDEEVRREYPVFWVCQKLSALLDQFEITRRK